MLIKENASQSGHWYKLDGEPAYTIIGANGKARATTLKDAKKHGLVPSVTTILGQIAKPGLDTWKQQQVLLAALTLPRHPDESEQQWLERVMLDSKETGKQAAERGTVIHGKIEEYFKQPYPNAEQYVVNAYEAINKMFYNKTWINEKSFASIFGYGGKVDLHAKDVVLDIKTTEKDPNTITPYFDQIMQLAAYRHGLHMHDAVVGNVFVNHLTNQVNIIIHDEQEVKLAWECFKDLLMFYKKKNKLVDI